jgi:hypothetical protein
MKTLTFITLLALTLTPLVHAADDETLEGKRWTISFRLGSFNTSDDNWLNRSSVRAAGGFEFSRLQTAHTALSVTLEGWAFTSRYFGMAPITVNYKLFPTGNGLRLHGEGDAPAVQPWIGAGAGLYFHEPSYWSGGTVDAGAHLSGGAVVPLGRIFEINGELRWAFTSQQRLFSYFMGFGFRF